MKIPITRGNHKLPYSTAILNTGGPALMCPSRALGLCQLEKLGCPDRCYARKAEISYGKVSIQWRMRQLEYWRSRGVTRIVDDFLALNRRARTKVTAIRLNEAGDFQTRQDVEQAVTLAFLLRDHHVTVYCYTARHDLLAEWIPGQLDLVINGSGFMAHNQYLVAPKGTAEDKIRELWKSGARARRCAGDCRKCSLCLEARGLTIVNELH